MELNNKFLSFTCNPEQGTFDLSELRTGKVVFKNARLQVQFVKRSKKYSFLLNSWDPFTHQKLTVKDPHHGKMETLGFVSGGSRWNIHLHLTFALPENEPFLLWKMEVGNFGEVPIFIEQFDLLILDPKRGGELGCLSKGDTHRPAFFSNGWQSWNYSATYGAAEKQRKSRLGIFQNAQNVNVSTPIPTKKGEFTSDFFGMVGDRNSRKGLLLGYLSQKQQFGSIKTTLQNEPAVRMWASGDRVQLNPGKAMNTDYACAFPMDIDHENPFEAYLNAVARENDIPAMKAKPTGWCSWYEFYEKIDDEKITRNIKAIENLNDELPLDLIQIDDGFEAQIGDWFDFKPGFKNGIKPHAESIRAAGKIPGLWLAPFIVHRKSKLFREHPEYILRNSTGMPVNSGFNWNSFTTSLDLTQPEALKYACKVVRKATEEWGFDYLKLDFLYAAALPGKHYDPTRTRAQVLHKGMEAIRKAVGDKVFLLGCGAPLGPMLGLVDAMRIGADVLGSWRTKWFGTRFIFNEEPHTPAAVNSIQNMLSRSMLHNQWWINDPDVLLIREDMELNVDEVRSLASIIFLTGGMVLLSDNLPKLSKERVEIAKVLLPPLDQRPRMQDWFDRQMPSRLKQDLQGATGKWCLISLSNWTDQPKTLRLDLGSFGLPEASYWVRSFWDQVTHQVESHTPLAFENVPAHATLVLVVRARTRKAAQYLGSSLHLSQGLEVSEFRPRLTGLDIGFNLPRKAKGSIELNLLKYPKKATLNGKAIQWLNTCENRFIFEDLEIDHKAKLVINY